MKKYSGQILIIYILIELALSGCAPLPGQSIRRHWKEDAPLYESQITLHQYYLPDFPDWLQFNSSSACFYQQKIKYLDLPKVRSTFSLSYKEAILLQQLMNVERNNFLFERHLTEILSRDEESIFFQSLEKVRHKLSLFTPPKFKKIHLLWIDPILQNMDTATLILKKWLEDPAQKEGYPIFISLCLGQNELDNLLEAQGIDEYNHKTIGREIFTPFDQSDQSSPHLMVYLNDLFRPDQTLQLFLTRPRPVELQGNLDVKNWNPKN